MEMLSRDDAERRIRERAASDPAFREELMANPRSAVESELGVAIPAEVSVHVHEESGTEVHLVLPAAEDRLSDAELEMVSGGQEYWEGPGGDAP
jgi:hypothetical protein